MPYSEKSLFQLKSFRYALWTPIIISALIVSYIFLTSNLSYEKGFTGLNTAWDIFKVPLAIFSLTFPSVALVAANHRSIQSKKQIETTESQNNFANYYKHLEEFKMLLEDQNIANEILNYRQLHLKFFPEVKLGNYEIKNSVRKDLISNFMSVYNKLKELEDLTNELLESDETQAAKQEKIIKGTVEAYSPIKSLRKNFQFKPNDQDNITEEGLNEYRDKIQMYNYISAISQTATNILEICKFSEGFVIPSIIVVISQLEENNGLIGGIPTNRKINFNLPKVTNGGETIRRSKSFSIVTTFEN